MEDQGLFASWATHSEDIDCYHHPETERANNEWGGASRIAIWWGGLATSILSWGTKALLSHLVVFVMFCDAYLGVVLRDISPGECSERVNPPIREKTGGGTRTFSLGRLCIGEGRDEV